MTDCVFCKIVSGEFVSYCIYEDEFFKVILDKYPATMGHTLILPKVHYENIYELGEKEAESLGALVVKIAKKLEGSLGCVGLNLVQSNGAKAGQEIFHFHMHLVPRYENDGIVMKWPSGNPTDEELMEAMKKLV